MHMCMSYNYGDAYLIVVGRILTDTNSALSVVAVGANHSVRYQ